VCVYTFNKQQHSTQYAQADLDDLKVNGDFLVQTHMSAKSFMKLGCFFPRNISRVVDICLICSVEESFKNF